MRAYEANGAGCEQSADDAFSSDEAVFGVGALEEFVEEEEDRGVAFGEVADLAEARDLGVEAGTALLQGIVDEDACADMQWSELQRMGAYRSTGHGEDGVDADGAHECAFAGHVGAADEQDTGFAADADVVADAFRGRNERVSELFGVEAGRALDEFREGIGRMLVAIGREGEERFEFADGTEPSSGRLLPWAMRQASAA